MEFAGIIAEYDPFHNGHAAQLQMLRAQGAGRIAVCISAAAVQRGGFPLLPEPVRVQAALQAGADLVAALPAPYACLGAEGFAAAGVALLTALGCDTLAFGAETPDAGLLMRAARLVDSPALAEGLQQASGGRRDLCGGPRRRGRGTGTRHGRAAGQPQQYPGGGILQGHPAAGQPPAAFAAAPPGRRPRHCRDRRHPGAAGGLGQLPAGAGLGAGAGCRAGICAGAGGGAVPASADRGELLDPDKFSVAVLSRLRGQGRQQLAAVRGLSEGLENRLYAAVQKAATVQELYDLLKTRRYPPCPAASAGAGRGAGGHGGACAPNAALPACAGARRQALGALRYAALPAGTSLAELARGSAPAEAVAQLHGAFADLSALCRQRPMPAGLAFTAKPVII